MEDLKTRTRQKSSKKRPSNDAKINSPHDRFFKTAMSDIRVAKAFFEHYLPASIRSEVDLNSLELCPNSYIDQTLDLSSSDVLYKVTIAGKTAFLYLLCEHQSSVDHFMPLRIWEYIVSIWRDHLKQTQSKTLPLVVPLVFYHGSRPYNGPQDIRDLIQAPQELIEKILFKPFHLIDMHHIADETLREQRWVGIMAFVMKHISAREFMVFIQSFSDMLQFLQQESRAIGYIEALLKYIVEAGNTDQPKAVADILREGLSNPGGEIVSIADKLVEMGREEGRAEVQSIADKLKEMGREEGIQTGELSILVRQLKRKFGLIPPIYQKRIQEADSEQLLHWADKILEAQNLDALFA